MVPGSHQWDNQIEHLRENLGLLSVLPEFKNVIRLDSSQAIEARPCLVKRGEVHFHYSLTLSSCPSGAQCATPVPIPPSCARMATPFPVPSSPGGGENG